MAVDRVRKFLDKQRGIPRYLMAALVTIDSSRLEVPPKLFTASATSIPAHRYVTECHKIIET